MGYDQKLIIVEKHMEPFAIAEFINGKHYYWGEKIASIEMGVVPAFYHLFKDKPTDCFVFLEDGNTMIVNDSYGDPMGMASLAEVVEVLEKEISGNDDRRLRPALGLLKGFDHSQWSNLVVLRYGH